MKNIRYIKLVVICFLLSFISVLNAAPVSKDVAKSVATNFYTSNYSSANVSMTLVYQENAPNGQPVYYIFNATSNGGNGFVIVSAEDAAHPILGYSNKGPFIFPDSKNHNNNIGWWLGCRKSEIIAARTKNAVAGADISNEWASYSSNNTQTQAKHPNLKTVNPLVQTTWDQSPYYNAFCPGGSVTGCVATAMAQIMKYWSYPPHGRGSSFYWDEPAFGYQNNFGYLSENYDTSVYNWAAMPLTLNSNNDGVAELMLDCGISVNMDYSFESGAWVITGDFPTCSQNSYVKYFGYNPHTIQGLYQAKYTNANWTALIENELNNKRPVQYVGWDSTNNSGHTWVCDGFDSHGNFDMNWGWGGSDDGYFPLNALDAGGYHFNWWNEALIGIEPPSASPYFVASPAFGCSGMNVQFTDQSVTDSNLTITSYKWLFPGGTPSTSSATNPTVQYNTPGTYNVTEIVSTLRGNDTLVRTEYISVASAASAPVRQGFESAVFPPAGWVINNPDNSIYAWELNDSTGGYNASSHCMEFNNANDNQTWINPPGKAGNDIVGQRQQIYTPEYDFTGVLNPTLYFDVAYEPYNINYSDTLNIYYSTDCGATFNPVYSKGGMTLCTTGFTVMNGGDTNSTGSFVPKANNWRTDTIHIPAISQLPSVMFSFENRSGNGSPIYIDNINLPGILTSVYNVSQSPSVSVYPNPSNGQFTFQLSGLSEQCTLEVYNVLGQQVYSGLTGDNSLFTINLSDRPQGLYIYRVLRQSGNLVSTGRLIIE